MIDYENALEIISGCKWPGSHETLAVEQGVGRILAENISMAGDQPPFDRATMDGVALAPIAEQSVYTLIGDLHAGALSNLTPAPGEAVRIMTGAKVPAGCTVVPIESCTVEDAQVSVSDPALRAPGRNIAWRGEDASAGTTILSAGQLLTPTLLAAAAMAGVRSINVQRPPRVGILSTGDEVGANHAAGINDSNGPFLQAACMSLGLPVQHQHVGDHAAALSEALNNQEVDLLLSSGGVSMGSRDFLPQALSQAGFQTRFHKVLIQPGKPILFAEHHDGRKLLALPGNPVAVVACWHLFVLPLLGQRWPGFAPRWCMLPAAQAGSHHKPRRLFLPARHTAQGLRPIPWNGSGDLLAAACGDGLIDMRPNSSWQAGDPLRFLPYLANAQAQPINLDRCHV